MTQTDERRLAIVTARRAGKTKKQVSEEFGITEATVDNAIKWAQGHGIFDKDNAVLLERRIMETIHRMEKTETIFEREHNRLMRLYDQSEEDESKKDGRLPFRIKDGYVPLVQELRNDQTLLMELQGLYKQNLQVQVSNTTNILVLPAKATDTEWMEMVNDIKEKARNDARLTDELTRAATMANYKVVGGDEDGD